MMILRFPTDFSDLSPGSNLRESAQCGVFALFSTTAKHSAKSRLRAPQTHIRIDRVCLSPMESGRAYKLITASAAASSGELRPGLPGGVSESVSEGSGEGSDAGSSAKDDGAARFSSLAAAVASDGIRCGVGRFLRGV